MVQKVICFSWVMIQFQLIKLKNIHAILGNPYDVVGYRHNSTAEICSFLNEKDFFFISPTSSVSTTSTSNEAHVIIQNKIHDPYYEAIFLVKIINGIKRIGKITIFYTDDIYSKSVIAIFNNHLDPGLVNTIVYEIIPTDRISVYEVRIDLLWYNKRCSRIAYV